MNEEKLWDKLWKQAARRGVETGARDFLKARRLFNAWPFPGYARTFPK